MDQLSNILKHVEINSKFFFSGRFCGVQSFGKQTTQPTNKIEAIEGDLHLLKAGSLEVSCGRRNSILLDQPTVIFIPSNTQHQLKAGLEDQTELVCAKVQYGGGSHNPLIDTLPSIITFPLNENSDIENIATLLFKEAFAESYGKQEVIEHLFDVFIVLVFRRMLNNQRLDRGMLAGLTHPKLSLVLSAIHDTPEKAWNLISMSEIASMSRSRFAKEFRDVVGQTPKDYVTYWRICLAQRLLRQGQPVSLVANNVGYENGSALARAFKGKIGLSPKEWLSSLRNSA